MAKQKKILNYTSREWNSIRQDLDSYVRRYYPTNYKDFSEAGFGSLTLDTVAYIGDILSFYLDYQANESFLDTAIEYDNVIKHGKALGYKFRANPTSYGNVDLFIVVPASSTGVGPDSRYIPILMQGTAISSTNGNGFILNENVNFADSNNEVVVAAVDETTGVPVSYAIKATGQVISGEIAQETRVIGDFTKFMKVELFGDNLAEVLSVVDSEGHEYFEVDYLSQNVIYKEITNRDSSTRELAKAILKPFIAARRFITIQEPGKMILQFGYGSNEEIKSNSVADPTEVVLQVHGKNYTADNSFDPSKLMQTDKFGVAPSNTTLYIQYRNNSSQNTNASVDTISDVMSPLFSFHDEVKLNNTTISSVKESLEVTNSEPIVGDISLPNSEELKKRIFDVYASQNRAVTKQDYLSLIYNMPPQFGGIKRANIVQDNDSFKRNLNLYVISEDEDGSLVTTNSVIKKNLKTWLQKNKMMNDTVDILNVKIVNIGIEFQVIAKDESNKFEALSDSVEALREDYNINFDAGEDFDVTRVYSVLKDVDSVLDVVDVKIVSKNGGVYSDTRFNLDDAMSADGRSVSCPENCIFEIKYMNSDIVGSVR